MTQFEDYGLMSHLDAIERLIARREPEVLALLPEDGRFDRLRREAAELLRRYPDPAARPPLFGVLVGVKDIFRVDGFATRAGTTLPPALFAGPEASCVSALRAAGALVLGKTVTTQFAYFAPGPTRHPLSAAQGEVRTPGGSSSGSAAAVAARFSPLALGTQTIGSIIRPAAFCGVVGFKPSFGRVPIDGVVPLSPSADTAGWFAASVAAAARAAAVMVPDWDSTGFQMRDLALVGEERSGGEGGKGRKGEEFSAALVLGFPEGPYLDRASDAGLARFQASVRRLVAAGYDVRPVPAMAGYGDIHTRHNALVAAEAARTHAAWFATYREAYHPKTAELILRGQAVGEAVYQRAVDGRERLRDELHDLMDRHELDLWIAPAAVGAALPGLESTGDPVMALPWTHAGLPAGTVAAGWPMGVQLVGRYGQDEQLLRLAGFLETALVQG